MHVHVVPAVSVQRSTPPDALHAKPGLLRNPTRGEVGDRMLQPNPLETDFTECPLTQSSKGLRTESSEQ